METKNLSLEKMEGIWGGVSCGLAIGVAAGSGLLIIGATIINPGIWASPTTWKSAATIVAGNAVNISSSCE